MKKLFVLIALAAFIAVHAGTAFSDNDHYQGKGYGNGPAPNSGDCVSDGPGWDSGSTYEF